MEIDNVKNYLVFVDAEFKKTFGTLLLANKYARALKNVFEVEGETKNIIIKKRTERIETINTLTTENKIIKGDLL